MALFPSVPKTFSPSLRARENKVEGTDILDPRGFSEKLRARKLLSWDPTLKALYYGGLSPGKYRRRDTPAYRIRVGLSDLYAGDPFNSLCGFFSCACFTPYIRIRTQDSKRSQAVAEKKRLSSCAVSCSCSRPKQGLMYVRDDACCHFLNAIWQIAGRTLSGFLCVRIARTAKITDRTFIVLKLIRQNTDMKPPSNCFWQFRL